VVNQHSFQQGAQDTGRGFFQQFPEVRGKPQHGGKFGLLQFREPFVRDPACGPAGQSQNKIGTGTIFIIT